MPDEVAVIGVDNDELVCDLSDPPLTSIALNTEKAGYEAAQLLDKMMAGNKAKFRKYFNDNRLYLLKWGRCSKKSYFLRGEFWEGGLLMFAKWLKLNAIRH